MINHLSDLSSQQRTQREEMIGLCDRSVEGSGQRERVGRDVKGSGQGEEMADQGEGKAVWRMKGNGSDAEWSG